MVQGKEPHPQAVSLGHEHVVAVSWRLTVGLRDWQHVTSLETLRYLRVEFEVLSSYKSNQDCVEEFHLHTQGR